MNSGLGNNIIGNVEKKIDDIQKKLDDAQK